MLQNIKIVLPLHCVFHGIRFKVGRLEVERLPSFFVLTPLQVFFDQIKTLKLLSNKSLSIPYFHKDIPLF
jgi:hypothetical protein